MNILFMLGVTIALYYLGYRYYARYIEKTFNVDGTHQTPAVELEDGVDYVPTRKVVVLGHHFASIAGGGPIIGPTVALIFGYLPVWLWILFGTLFFGAMHDFSVLLTSLREKGKSIAEIAKHTLGRKGFLLIIAFTVIMLLIVTSVFLTLTTTALSSKYPAEYFSDGLEELNTVVENGVTFAVIGGIASTSVIFITFCAPFLGWLLYKRKLNSWLMSLLAILICVISIKIGLLFPISIDSFTWMVILSVYTFIAAGVPVWIILQPRDFANSFLLYGGMAGLIGGTIILGLKGETLNIPATNIVSGNLHLGYIWPILFITVACGAISGFHALVAGGTTSKQISKEKPDAKIVGFGGMLLEGILALGVLIAIGTGISFEQFQSIVFPTAAGIKSNPILAFALGMGGLLNQSFTLPLTYGVVFGILLVEGFIVTTLDTAVRLNRYLFEELWNIIFKKTPAIFKTYSFNSFFCVILMFLLAYFNAFKQLWQLFGSANQLLAAVTLLTISVWLLIRKKEYLFALIPGIFMLITTIVSLIVILYQDYLPKRNYVLALGDIALLALAGGVIVLVFKRIRMLKPSIG